MVCREIISCPVVQELRGPLGLCRITYCETGALPCAIIPLLRDGKLRLHRGASEGGEQAQLPVPHALPSGEPRREPSAP